MKLFKTLLIYKLSLLLMLSTIVQIPAFAQRRATTPSKKQTAKVPIEKGEKFCDGWRGKITYVQNVKDERITNESGGYKRFFKVIQVEGEVNLAGGNSGPGKISIANLDIQDIEERREGDCGNWMTGPRKKPFVEKSFIQFDESGAASGNVPVTVSIHGGEYSFDVFMPVVRGTTSMQGKSSQKGYCNPENDNEKVSPPMENPKQFDPIRFRIQGTVDPKNPNVLRGTLKYDPNVTINWDLTRAAGDCDEGDLSVAGLKIEHHVFPDPAAWHEIGENTIDGNQVKLTATVSNSSEKSKSGTLMFKEKTSGEVLGTQPVSVPGGGEKEVEIIWDTNGYAWTDGGAKMPNRQIEAVLSNGEQAEADVKVYPKPVILVHELWSNAAAWSDYPGYLAEIHSFAWKAFAVGADPAHGKMNTGDSFGNTDPTNSIFQNAQELGKQIKFAQESENAWHIDVVAHSMGGLITRFYIHSFMKDPPDGKPVINRLVMLGTPNMGSPWADIMFDKYKRMGKHVEALNQLRTEECARFNQTVTNRKGVKFSIVYTDSIPFTGDTLESGDGVVSKSSAIWQIFDISHSNSLDHTSLTGKEDFLRYVLLRLATGPKKFKQRAGLSESSPAKETPALNRIGENWLASFNPKGFIFSNNEAYIAPFPQTERGKTVVLKPNQTIEIEIPATKAKRGGISFAAPPNVSATLLDAEGEIIGENLAETSEANSYFRYILVEKLISGETWKLKLENRDDQEVRIFYAAVFDTNPLSLEFVEIQRQEDGSIKMQAKLTNNGAAVKSAVISVKINNQTPEIALLDDGNHDDGAANDGIYGATTGKLVEGKHFIEAKAALNGASATATAVLSLDTVNQ